MFSYVFMKILEMRPRSYDRRMDKVSRGRLGSAKVAVAREIPRGSRVLEIGCGTGELAVLVLERDCTVEGFDLSPSMVKATEERVETDNLRGRFSVRQMGVEGMDSLPDEHFDTVVSTLVFSELNGDERRFALKHAARVLRPDGRIIIADEVVAQTAARRVVNAITRMPLLVVTYLFSGQSTRPIEDIAGEMSEAGLIVEKEMRSHGDSFAIVVGLKKKGDKA